MFALKTQNVDRPSRTRRSIVAQQLNDGDFDSILNDPLTEEDELSDDEEELSDLAAISAVSSLQSSGNQNKENDTENVNDVQYTTPFKKQRIVKQHFHQSFNAPPLSRLVVNTIASPQIPEEKDLTSVCFIEHNNVPILYAHGMRQLIASMRVSLGKLNDVQIPRLADISNSVDGIVPVPMFPNTTLQMISYSVFKRKGLIMGMQQNPEATEFVAMHRIDDTLPAVSGSCRRSKWGVEVAESNRKKYYVVNWEDASGLAHRPEFIGIADISAHFSKDYKFCSRKKFGNKLKKDGLSMMRGKGTVWNDPQKSMTAKSDFKLKSKNKESPPITITITRCKESYA